MYGLYANALVALTPGGIERQEAEGQRNLVRHADRLPIQGTSGAGRQKWEAAGFVFGEVIDDLWVACTFPSGWKMVATDHSMWNDVVDETGKKRALVFYKAAFYDRSAHTFGLDEV